MTEIKYVEQGFTLAPQQQDNVTMSCPIGFVPAGMRLISDRVLAKFSEVPDGRVAKIDLFNWAGGGSGNAIANIKLICITEGDI